MSFLQIDFHSAILEVVRDNTSLTSRSRQVAFNPTLTEQMFKGSI